MLKKLFKSWVVCMLVVIGWVATFPLSSYLAKEYQEPFIITTGILMFVIVMVVALRARSQRLKTYREAYIAHEQGKLSEEEFAVIEKEDSEIELIHEAARTAVSIKSLRDLVKKK